MLHDPPETHFVSQSELSSQLGVSIDVLRSVRKRALEEGVDWKHDGNVVFYTLPAIEKVRGHLGLASPPQASPEAPQSSPTVETVTDSDPQPEAQSCMRVRVVSRARDFQGRRIHFANPAVIRCEVLAAPGELLWVRVRLSTNYSPQLRNGDPMELEVTKIAGHWHHLGRAPRHPGKW